MRRICVFAVWNAIFYTLLSKKLAKNKRIGPKVHDTKAHTRNHEGSQERALVWIIQAVIDIIDRLAEEEALRVNKKTGEKNQTETKDMVDERDWKSLFGKEENTHIRISVKGATSAMVDVLRAFPLDVQNLYFLFLPLTC